MYGEPQRLLLRASIAITGEVILVGKPFVETTWAKEIGSDGRPRVLPDSDAGRRPAPSTCPDWYGGTNFMSPSFDADAQPVLRDRP